MEDEPREYDREFTTPLEYRVRRRLGFDTDRGDVVRFVVQLEYHHHGEWQSVVRYDRDGTDESEFAHDVTEEGLHIDIYRDGEKEATEYVAPPLRADLALDRAEDHLLANLERYITRYERWHGISNR
jgi:hypothetical protein